MQLNRVAVLGGSGFIGRYIVQRLAERGCVVAVGGRNAASARFLKVRGDVGQVELLNISIADPSRLPAFLEGNQALVNCVGILQEGGAQRFEAIHHTAPALLGRLAREAGIERFVHISAIGADPRSASAYARTKGQGEQALRDACPTVTILRPSLVFGPEDHFFNRFGALALLSPVLPLIGGGETRFQPIYVGDVAAAAIRCLDDPATAGRTYELGGPQTYTFRALLELLLAEIGRKRLFVDIPFAIASLQARLISLVPNAPLTPDQVEMLKVDNTVAAGALGFAELGMTPTPLEAILPSYLDRFRKGGYYARRRAA